ncbi:MAG: hypothetical protein U5K79_01710 [Cyclobacteriaceae bacterium]|nr:hypothetical protein [Cyclobacteriaceae bacterium]
MPILKNPVGYDLLAASFGIWNDNYKWNAANYGMRSEMDFAFQLFLSDLSRGGKWLVEPPHYSFYINNTESGHGTNPNYHHFEAEYFNYTHPDSKYKFTSADEKAINDAVVKLNGVFAVFPFENEMAPGVNAYKESVDGHFYHIIVFNPERPPYWIPVTLKELADMYVEFYTSQKDDFLLPQLKKEIAEFSEEELNAPAYFGHDTHFVLRANSKNEGLQLMRFNPAYWDKSLPPSAIQFMTFNYFESTPEALDEHFKNNGYPKYNEMLLNEIDWESLAKMIMRK